MRPEGTREVIVVRSPGSLEMVTSPPRASSRSLMLCRPEPRAWDAGSNPGPEPFTETSITPDVSDIETRTGPSPCLLALGLRLTGSTR